VTTRFEPYPTHSSERREWIRRHLGEIPWPDAPLAEKEAWRDLYGLSATMAANAMKDAAAIRFEAKYGMRPGSVDGRPHGEPMRETAPGVPSQEEKITTTSPPPSPPEPSETNANYSDDPYPRGVKGGRNTLESHQARRDWIERHRPEMEELAVSRKGVDAYAKRYGIPLGSITQLLDRVASEKDGLGAGHLRQARPSDGKPRSDESAQAQPAILADGSKNDATRDLSERQDVRPIESIDDFAMDIPEGDLPTDEPQPDLTAFASAFFFHAWLDIAVDHNVSPAVTRDVYRALEAAVREAR
jgi:hypothetical protein